MKNRENLYRFLGKIYRKEVDQNFLDQMNAMEFPIDGPDSDLSKGFGMIRDYLEHYGDDALTDLAVDYAKVFLAAGASQSNAAFPYESVYTSRKRIVMQDAWEKVCEIYTAKGLAKGNVTKDIMEDHITLELEYMALLCKEAQEDEENWELLYEQRDFLNQHLLNWVPEFCADINKYADTMFYKSIGKITDAYLKLDRAILDSMIDSYDSKTGSSFSCQVSLEKMDEIIKEMQKNYKIYAPKRFEKRGTKNNADLIRYDEIHSVKEIVYDKQSDFSPKEVFYPVSQVMIHFTEDNCRSSIMDDTKGIIIFARPCDINGIKRLDNIFLKNGGSEDTYYKRMRDKVKIFMLECRQGWEDCFCVSMGSNKTDNYSLAVRFEEKNLLIRVKDNEFGKYFDGEAPSNFIPEFVQSNSKEAKLPKIENREQLKIAGNLDMWKDYDDMCIGCGGCNTVCPTCSCFDTVDVIYNETSRDGERRRVWSSCMLDTYTMTAGGNRSRKTHGANMRFKVLHKVYDYNARFGGMS
jgi:anaerobic sulfite reductase subunit A